MAAMVNTRRPGSLPCLMPCLCRATCGSASLGWCVPARHRNLLRQARRLYRAYVFLWCCSPVPPLRGTGHALYVKRACVGPMVGRAMRGAWDRVNLLLLLLLL